MKSFARRRKDVQFSDEQRLKLRMHRLPVMPMELGQSVCIAQNIIRKDYALKGNGRSSIESQAQCSAARARVGMDEVDATPLNIRCRGGKGDREWVIRLDNVLSRDECSYYVGATRAIGFSAITHEYPEDYRKARRAVVICDELAHQLWRKLSRVLHVQDAFFESDCAIGRGVWRAVRVNECFRFSEYKSGGDFKAHRDGPYVESPSLQSMYTLLIYLNDASEFKGGETRFYQNGMEWNASCTTKDGLKELKKCNKKRSNITVSPKAGRAIIFPHHMVHEGRAVTRGAKYVLRTDIMFEKFREKISTCEADLARSENVMALLRESDKAEADGNARLATETYVAALRAMYSCSIDEEERSFVDEVDKETDESGDEELLRLNDECRITCAPTEVLLRVATFLNMEDVVVLQRTCRRFCSVFRCRIIWQEYYTTKWSDLPDNLGDRDDLELSENSFQAIDWYRAYAARCCLEKPGFGVFHYGKLRFQVDVGRVSAIVGTAYHYRAVRHGTCISNLYKAFDPRFPFAPSDEYTELENSEWTMNGLVGPFFPRKHERLLVIAPYGADLEHAMMLRPATRFLAAVNEASALAHYVCHQSARGVELPVFSSGSFPGRKRGKTGLVIGIGHTSAYVAVVKDGIATKHQKLGAAGDGVDECIRQMECMDYPCYTPFQRASCFHRFKVFQKLHVSLDLEKDVQAALAGKSTRGKQPLKDPLTKFMALEALFDPSLCNRTGYGIMLAITSLLQDEEPESVATLLSNVITFGGCTEAAQFHERLMLELTAVWGDQVHILHVPEEKRLNVATVIRGSISFGDHWLRDSEDMDLVAIKGFNGEILL